MTLLNRLAIAATSLLMTACAGNGPVFSYPQQAYDVGQKTFRVMPTHGPKHVARADGRLTPMIVDAMQQKGYTGTEEGAELDVVYEVRGELQSGVEQTPVVTSRGTYQRTEFVERLQGAMVLMVVDTASGKTLYMSSASDEIHPPLSNEQLRAVVDGLLEKFPSAKR